MYGLQGHPVIIDLKDIVASYGDEPVIKGINLYIRDGEFITLLGPSGCGKTTTLRIIAGFTQPDEGDILFAGQRINDLPPHKRQVNTIFQRYALFPHLDVFENVAFGLRVKKRSADDVTKMVGEMLRLVGLTGFEKRRVTALSGGQQQRVAIARALANEPKVLLLDEPLGALDLKLRREMQRELKRIQNSLGITFVYVTHDQEEALSMSDTVVVMDHGVIQQIGTPQDIYNEPENAFVANFIGESNILDGIMPQDQMVEFLGRSFTCVDAGFAARERVDVVVRPEDIMITSSPEAHLKGTVESVTFKGDYYEIMVNVHGQSMMVESTRDQAIGSAVGMIIEPDAIHIMHKSAYSGKSLEEMEDNPEVAESEI